MSSTEITTRTRILEATVRLLEDGGGNNVRMSDIARAAGISRQAVYLHFENRGDLLVAAARHFDTLKESDSRLAESRAAATGRERLRAYVHAWGYYIPVVWPMVRALLAIRDRDPEARDALDDRMQAMRGGCQAAVDALARDGDLRPDLDTTTATDLLWTLLSVRNWASLVQDCGWTQDAYVAEMQRQTRLALLNSDRSGGC